MDRALLCRAALSAPPRTTAIAGCRRCCLHHCCCRERRRRRINFCHAKVQREKLQRNLPAQPAASAAASRLAWAALHGLGTKSQERGLCYAPNATYGFHPSNAIRLFFSFFFLRKAKIKFENPQLKCQIATRCVISLLAFALSGCGWAACFVPYHAASGHQLKGNDVRAQLHFDSGRTVARQARQYPSPEYGYFIFYPFVERKALPSSPSTAFLTRREERNRASASCPSKCEAVRGLPSNLHANVIHREGSSRIGNCAAPPPSHRVGAHARLFFFFLFFASLQDIERVRFFFGVCSWLCSRDRCLVACMRRRCGRMQGVCAVQDLLSRLAVSTSHIVAIVLSFPLLFSSPL